MILNTRLKSLECMGKVLLLLPGVLNYRTDFLNSLSTWSFIAVTLFS